MAAHTAGTLYDTEFGGNYHVVTVLVDAGTQTGTVAITGMATITGATASLAEAPSADAAIITVGGFSGSVVTVNEYTAQLTLNTQTALDFYLTVIGKY